MDHETIIAAIDRSGIRGNDYRAARLLLDRVSNQWTVYLDQETACWITGVQTWAAARRVLNRLKDVGLIALHTNSCAYVTFICRAPADHSRAESAREEAPEPSPETPDRAELARQRANSARGDEATRAGTARHRAPAGLNRAESARQRADSARPLIGLTNTGGLGGRDNPTQPSPEGGPGETGPEPAPSADDQARSYALLTDPDVGASDQLAAELALRYPFEQVRRQVFRYLRDLGEDKVHSVGVLRSRLQRRLPATITDRDRASDLWQRHSMPSDANPYQPAEYDDPEPEQPPAQPEPPAPEPGTPAAYWAELLVFEAAAARVGGNGHLLQGSTVVGYDAAANAFEVALADATRLDWARSKLSRSVGRTLSMITRRDAVVWFVAAATAEGD